MIGNIALVLSFDGRMNLLGDAKIWLSRYYSLDYCAESYPNKRLIGMGYVTSLKDSMMLIV